jgi:hypothetical protein
MAALTEVEKVALHEAAHAVVAETLLPGSVAAVKLTTHGGHTHVLRRVGDPPLLHALVGLAGALVEPCPAAPGVVDEDVAHVVARLAEAYLRDETVGVKVLPVLLRRHRPQVKAVARALLEHRHLTGREVRRLLREVG